MTAASCSVPTPELLPAGPALHAQLERGLAQSTTDFERKVFRDAIRRGGIIQEEYEKAFVLYSDCVRAEGVIESYRRLPSGIYRVIGSNAETKEQMEEAGKVIQRCADGSIMRIEAVYRMQLFNPAGEPNLFKLAVECLIRERVAGPDYSEGQLRKALQWDGSPDHGNGRGPDLRSGKAVDCLYNYGFAV
ncbi:hypothetical protein [Streptomyces sp. NPDC001774]